MKKWCVETACPYFARVEVPYAGDLNTEVIIVGESPGREEILKQQPFIGMSGRVLNAVLDSIDLGRGNVLIANACRCLLNKEDDDVKDQNAALKLCRGKLEKVINRVHPKLIIALGATALKQLTGKQKIMENRGRFFWSDEFNCQIFCTVHPAYVLRGAAREFWTKPAPQRSMKENLLFIDFEQAKKFLEDGQTNSLEISETYREGTPTDLKLMQKNAKVVAVDFETTGLDMFNEEVRVLSVSLCSEEGLPLAFFYKKGKGFPAGVRKILEDPKITKLVAARPFEERVCRQKLGFEMKGPIHDVLVMAHLLDENFYSYNLESVADLYTALKGIKSLAQGKRANLEELPKEQLLKYNSVDADATLRAYKLMRGMMKKDPRLLRYYVFFTQKIQDMLADTYFNGGTIDTSQLATDQHALEELQAQLHEECLAIIPKVIKEDKRHVGKLQLSRPSLVQDYLFLHPKGLRLKPNKEYLTKKTRMPQCTEDHLRQFKKHPFILKIIRMKKAEKILSTYIASLWKTLKPDGMIYPSTLMAATVTGRTVMREPTIQTIPQRSEFAPFIKRAFVAPEGWEMGTRDLSQSEIRIIGWLAKDPNILDALAKGIDIHTKTAAIVNHCRVQDVTKEMRRGAKGVNFGFIYGMGPFGFVFYAKNEYNQIYTLEQATDLRGAYFARPDGYWRLPEYYREQEHDVTANGFVRSPIGRMRRLSGAHSRDEKERRESVRQAINFPTQSFSSDLGLIGMYLFWKRIKELKLTNVIKPMWFIHDAIYFIAKKGHMHKAMRILKQCLEEDTKAYVLEKFGVKIGYPITSDAKTGASWAAMRDFCDKCGFPKGSGTCNNCVEAQGK